MVLGNAARLGAVGLGVGVALAYVAGRSMEALLAGVRPGDAETFAAAVALVVVMLVIGTVAPAVRALRIDPVDAIRTE
jgi:ABC-type antimicrobial peptide transport system permease subunit